MRPDDVSDGDILKVRLAEECNWECPYTGKSISHGRLWSGQHAQFDIEHIIPFSRSLDNSFLNKTLCYHEENRNVKQNRTPYEAYSGDETKWQEILGRVKRFRGQAGYAKLRKFQQKELGRRFRRAAASGHPLYVAAGGRISRDCSTAGRSTPTAAAACKSAPAASPPIFATNGD